MTSTPTPSLAVAVIGAGRIGSAVAFQLRRASHAVTVVARPGSRRLAQLRRDGGIVLTNGDRAVVKIAEHLDEQAQFDLVIVTVLAHQAGTLLPALQRSPARCVHFMFVTPEAERLRSAVGADRATFGMAAVLATLDGDGRLGLTIPKTKAMQGDQRWVNLFRAAGMPSALEPDMGRWLRSQVPLTIAMEGVSVAGMRHKRGAGWAEARTGARALRAGYSILRGLGETPYPGAKKQISRAPGLMLTLILWGVSRSRFRETVGNSAEECRGLIDLLAAEAAQVPALGEAAGALRALRPAKADRDRAAPSRLA
ncbi:putative oxidoreductase [Actinacidiphila reveromycinica]|uniref:Putative oxidoreductase n=1 Tax=Actinacidiphila reveromycinica TaxID=659352 RepID=A0A7U3VS32_9ACTN|nr:2-dehydropantoate 2-reductase [Streptomyces sp. SN-593]BBB01436.1 putative oxidoreductase [Streptomyces sp. SN-593]